MKTTTTLNSSGAVTSDTDQLKDSAFTILRQKGLIPNTDPPEVSFHSIYTKDVVDFFVNTILDLSAELQRISATSSFSMAEMHAQTCRQRSDEILQQYAT